MESFQKVHFVENRFRHYRELPHELGPSGLNHPAPRLSKQLRSQTIEARLRSNWLTGLEAAMFITGLTLLASGMWALAVG
jgi:hypothetical protein